MQERMLCINPIHFIISFTFSFFVIPCWYCGICYNIFCYIIGGHNVSNMLYKDIIIAINTRKTTSVDPRWFLFVYYGFYFSITLPPLLAEA